MSSKKGTKATKGATAAPEGAGEGDDWTLVTNRRRNARKWDGKRVKKGMEADIEAAEDKEAHRTPAADAAAAEAAAAAAATTTAPRTRAGAEHATEPARVVLLVATEVEETGLRSALTGRPYEVVGVATLEGTAAFADAEAAQRAGARTAADAVGLRALLRELGADVCAVASGAAAERALCAAAVEAGAYALVLPVAAAAAAPAEGPMVFAAVPTAAARQRLVDALGVVADASVRADFAQHGLAVPEAAGYLDVYVALMHAPLRKLRVAAAADVVPRGDQFVQDVAAQARKCARYPAFAAPFCVGRLDCFTAPGARRVIYEIHADDTPEVLRSIAVLLGAPLRQRLAIPVSKYQGTLAHTPDDPARAVAVDFEKIIYAAPSHPEAPLYELYLPSYVEPLISTPAAPAPAEAAVSAESAAAVPAQ